ncbi:hypothetical protein NE865_02369 [Phthorimaea operculella]|nr:hypothetical protein NE865_02369 [Phthorimaea operculella]
MAVTRREYIFSAFLLGLLCVLLTVVAIASDSWVQATAAATGQTGDNIINYGLFRGEYQVNVLATPTSNTLYMTCVADENACAVSCKTTPEARKEEVRLLAQGRRPNVGCNADASVISPEQYPPSVISMAFYVSLLVFVFLHLLSAVVSSALAIVNATRNPTEPIFGLPGCLWSNVATGLFGLLILLMFGIYWATSGLKDHLALSDIIQGNYTLNQSLGYSYWLLIAAILCSAGSAALVQVRNYLLERDPPPPTIKVENHSDGTIFLY